MPLPPIAGDELLARFVMARGWIRAEGTVKSDAFRPPRDLNLSATRHLGLSPDDLWRIGDLVASDTDGNLLGRVDVSVSSVSAVGLEAEPAPLPENPNHVHIVGWPADKPSQKALAQKLAARAHYVPNPRRSMAQ